jgi:signal transduction histidine kinase
MRLKAAPSLILSLAALVAAVMALGVMYAALAQPWTGLTLGAQGERVIVIAATGPATGLPPGAEVEALSGGGERIRLEPLDLTLEPDGAMGDYANYRRFLDRQEILARILRAGAMEATIAGGQTFAVAPEPRRPVASLPVAFWVQLVVGVIAWAIAASVFAFRRHDSAARYLLLSGAATLVFAPFAGVYSTRELALPGALFQWLNDLNFLGGSLFAASFVALLLNYPRRVGPGWLGPAVVAAFAGWFIAQQAGAFDSMTFARRFHVMLAVLATFALAGWHWFASRRAPDTRAALQWFLLSWVVGTGLFALFILLPQMFGVDTSGSQGYAFLLFLLVYGGLAFGVLRYRLFDLDLWWTGALLWLLAALMLIALDFLFLFVLHLSSEVSLALALLICGVLWLPLRGLIWSRLFVRREPQSRSARFRQVTDVALAPPGADRQARWQALLADVFGPLEVATRSADGAVAIDREGLALLIPGADGLAGLRLAYADGGRRLFGPRDIELAGELLDMLAVVAESRKSYERGVATERGRIARDIHDNIGAQLMTALHSPAAERKDMVIRETLQDLRGIINDSAAEAATWPEALADLRQETAERLHAAGLDLDWQVDESLSFPLDAPTLHTLRSILREAVSNTLRHADATAMHIRVTERDGKLALDIRDDGKGLEEGPPEGGNGLANMRARVEALSGRFAIMGDGPGLRLGIVIPLEPN